MFLKSGDITMKLLDTIAAVSSPYGKGGVALIRISGSRAIDIGNRIFVPRSGTRLCDTEAAKLVYGDVTDPHSGEVIDNAMATIFKAPRSFTGEDTVEISCHGGILVTRSVLAAALSAGARAAEAGEFTKRAYINGKMRLSEAEALGNLLEAKSDSQLSLARGGLKGTLAKKLDSIYEDLRSILASVYAAIDFPDEDLAEMGREEMITSISDSIVKIKALAATYNTGRAINEGIPTVICGRTNAGKSSVYNRIVGYDAAIVTDIEGTTRDCLRESATLGKTLLLLCDTAGLRNTDDKIESIGIDRARDEISRAGLILAVFDSSRPLSDEDIALADEVSALPIPSIALLNKSDLSDRSDMTEILSRFDNVIELSAQSGEGFDLLAQKIDSLFIDGSINISSDAVVVGARQYASIRLSLDALETALADLSAGIPLDLCCVAIEQALTSIGEIDGRELGEEIVSEIFSHFCVGK